MITKVFRVATLLILISTPAWGEILTLENLQGPWMFAYWSEKGDENNKRIVKVPMDFRPDGTVIRKERTRNQTARYEIKGDAIIFIDKGERQEWKLVSFSPGKAFTVSRKGALMFFEKK